MLRTKFIAPVPALSEGWDRANALLGDVVRGALTTARAEGSFSDREVYHEACLAAAALLAQGDREAAKDLLRAMARARELSGFSDRLIPSLQHLLTGFRAWTADDEFLDRYQSGLSGLNRSVPPRPSGRQATARAAPQGVVVEVIERLWGLSPDAPAGNVQLAPLLEAGWPRMALLGVRVGATTFDLYFQRSRSGYSLRASSSHGPRVRVTVRLEELAPTGIWVDEERLGGQRAVFDLAGEHEVRIET